MRFLLLVLITFWRTLYAADDLSTVQSPEGHTIHEITLEIVGDTGAEAQSVLKNLQTQERNAFSQIEFDQDLKTLAREFDTIDPTVSVAENEVNIRIKARKKPLITSIEIRGNNAFETKKLMKEGGLQDQKLLDRQQLSTSLQKIRAYYVKRGYFEVEVTQSVQEVGDGRVAIVINVQEGRAGFIAHIRLHNLTKKEKALIRDRMMTQEYSFFLSWLTGRGTYYIDVFRQDEMMILSYLQNEGFLDAKVGSKIRASKMEKDRIVIDVHIDRGQQYFFGNISFEGMQNLFTNDQLLAKIGIRTGDPYSPDAIRRATKRIYDIYGSKGYIDSSAIPDMKLATVGETDLKTPIERTYDVVFRLQQGRCYRVGFIQIVGNTKTDASVILHETPLVPGAVFDSTMLAKTEERLRNIGYFKSVNVYAVKPSERREGDELPLRDIHIEVEEHPTTAQFALFAGYNTTESISGGVSLSESNCKLSGLSNFWRDGFRALRGGGEYLGCTATLGLKQRSYTLSWTKPYIFDSKWALGVDLQKMDNAYASSDYTIKSKEAVFSLRRPLNAFLSFATHYRLRNGHIDLNGIKRKRRNRQLIRESKNGGTISAVGVSLNYDSTNHPVNPNAGIRSSLSLEYAGLLGDHSFANFGYLNTFFFRCSQDGVLKLKGNLQLIQTLFGTKARRLPMDERLYLGGEGTVRGYRYNAVGPSFKDRHHTPRGGRTSLLLSAEYEHRLTTQLSTFVFTDAGDVWWKTFQFGMLRYSVGLGFRFYITENAPLSIGYAVPVNPTRKKDTQRFYISIGGVF